MTENDSSIHFASIEHFTACSKALASPRQRQVKNSIKREQPVGIKIGGSGINSTILSQEEVDIVGIVEHIEKRVNATADRRKLMEA